MGSTESGYWKAQGGMSDVGEIKYYSSCSDEL